MMTLSMLLQPIQNIRFWIYYVLMILLLLGFGRYIYAMIVRLILQRKKYKAKENHMELGCYHKAVRAI